MLDQDISPPQHGEEVRVLILHREQARRGRAGELGIGQIGPLHRVGDADETSQVDQAVDLLDLVGGDPEFRLQHGQDLPGKSRRGLDPDHRAEAPLAELLLDGREQVGFVLVDIKVRVPGHPEEPVSHHLHAREEPVKPLGDDPLDRHEGAPASDPKESRGRRRHLDPSHPGGPLSRLSEHDGDRERQVAEVGEWVSRVDGQGRQ